MPYNISLSAADSVTQTGNLRADTDSAGGGDVDIDALTGSIATTGSVEAVNYDADAGNAISIGGNVTTTGTFEVGTNFEPTGAIRISSTIDSTGDITVNGGADISTTGTLDSDGAVSIDAGNVLDINANIGGASIVLNADGDGSVDAAITADSSFISISADGDFAITAPVNAETNVTVVAGGTVTQTATIGNTGTTDNITIIAENGGVDSDAALAGTASINVTAAQGIDFASTLTAGAAISATAGGDLVTNAGLIDANGGSVDFNSGANIVVGSGNIEASDDIILAADDNITQNGTVTAADAVTITAATGWIDANAAITGTAGAVDVRASEWIDIASTLTAGTSVNVNGGANVTTGAGLIDANGGSLTLDSGENLTLGAGGAEATGVITLTGADSVTQSGNVSTTANVDIDAVTGSFLGSGTIGGADVTIDAGNTASLGGAITATGDVLVGQSIEPTGLITVTAAVSSGDDITIDGDADVTVTGALSLTGDLDINAGANLTQSSAVSAAGVALRADTGSVVTGSAIAGTAVVTAWAAEDIIFGEAVTGSSVTATAGSDIRTDEVVTGSAGPVGLTAGSNIWIGTGGLSGTGLTVAAVDDVNVSGALTGGTGNVDIDVTTGNLTGNSAITGANISIDVAQRTNLSGDITGTGTLAIGDAIAPSDLDLSGAISATSVQFTAGDVNVTGTVTANGTGARVAANGDLVITATDDSIVTTAAISATGNITLSAIENVSVAGATADSNSNGLGNLSITADSDFSSSGDVTISGAASGEDVNVRGYNVSVAGITANNATSNSGGAALTLTAENDLSIAGDLAISANADDVVLSSTTHSIEQSSGAITTAGDVVVTAADDFWQKGSIAVGESVSITTGDDATVNNIAANRITARVGGTLTEAGDDAGIDLAANLIDLEAAEGIGVSGDPNDSSDIYNPIETSGAPAAVSGDYSADGTTVTYTVTGHGLAVGDTVSVGGTNGYDTTAVEVTAVLDANRFQTAQTGAASSSTGSAIQITRAANNVATVEGLVSYDVGAPHSLSVGDEIAVDGNSHRLEVVSVAGNTFVVKPIAGTLSGLGVVTATETDSTVTYVTASGHRLQAGDAVVIEGTDGHNGALIVDSVVDATTFTVKQVAAPWETDGAATHSELKVATTGEDADIAIRDLRDQALAVSKATTRNGDIVLRASHDVYAMHIEAFDFAGGEVDLDNDGTLEPNGMNGRINDSHRLTLTTDGDIIVHSIETDDGLDLQAGGNIVTDKNGDGIADGNILTGGDIIITVPSTNTTDQSFGGLKTFTDIKITNLGSGTTTILKDGLWALNDIYISSLNDILIHENGVTAGRDVWITAGDGMAITWTSDILDADQTAATNITAGRNINLTVDGLIGETIDPLDIEAGRALGLNYNGNGQVETFWAVIEGTIGGDPLTEEIPEFVNFNGPFDQPPGHIFYNGDVIGGPELPYREYIRATVAHNIYRSLINEQAVLTMMPANFNHVVVEMNDLWEIPAIEYINQGGGYIFGLPMGTELPANIDVLETQDTPYLWFDEVENGEQSSAQ